MSLEQEFNDRIAQIKVRFAFALGETVNEFEQLRLQIKQGQDADSALRELGAGMHKLRGVAPTLGFMRIGELATQSEDCINAIFGQGKSEAATARFFGCLDGLLHEMKTVATPS